MLATLLIRFGGLVCLIFGGIHIFMGEVMEWNSQLSILSQRNWAVVHMLNYGAAFMLFTFAFISFRHTDEMTRSPLGRSMCVLIAIFWLLRAVGRVALGGLLEAQGPAIPILYVLLFVCYGAVLLKR